MRWLTVLAVLLALASASLLYTVNYGTRLVEARVHALEREALLARSDIAVLKAERAHLARPERIAPLARALGLQPMTEKQFARATADPALTTGSTAR
jgi:cell division protein FtsL